MIKPDLAKLVSLMFFALFIFSCSGDDVNDDLEPIIFGKGTYVLNQGVFPTGNGSVSYISEDFSEQETDIVSAKNENYKLGNIAQGLAFSDKYACVTINNGGQADFFDKDTWEYKFSITNLQLPRYPYYFNNKWYITQWGATGNDGKILIFAEDGLLLDEINTGGAPDKILFSDNKIYVLMSNGYDIDNRLFIYDNSHILVKSIDIGSGPNSLLKVENDILVLCEGHWSGANGQLTILKNDEIFLEKELPTNTTANLNYFNGKYYFNTTTDIYTFEIQNEISFQNLSLGTYLYGCGINDKGELVVSDAKDFNSAGSVYLIESDLNVVREFTVDVAPGQIYFR
jgi:hypothetical protein